MIYRIIVATFLFSKLCGAATAAHELERAKQTARIQDTHEQELNYLQNRQAQFLDRLSVVGNDLDHHMKTHKLRKDRNSVLPTLRTYYRPEGVEQWMRRLFPHKLCAQWFGKEDALAMMQGEERPKLKPYIEEGLRALSDSMMETRRQITGQFGALGLELGKPKARVDFIQEGSNFITHLSQQEEAPKENEVQAYFQVREGEELADLRLEMCKAMRRLNDKRKRLQAVPDSQDLQTKIQTHLHALKGRIGRLIKWKLLFYREALFFYQKGDGGFDQERFKDPNRGVHHLWRYLTERKSDFRNLDVVYEGDKGTDVGGVLYESLRQKKDSYIKARGALLEEVEAARAGRETINKETRDFKALVDTVRTLDPHASLKAIESNEAKRVMLIMDLEQQLFLKTGVTLTDIKEAEEKAEAAYQAYHEGVESAVAAYQYYLQGHQPRPSLIDS